MHLEKRNNVVINLTSSRSCGRQNMRDIKTLLTAPISRISSCPQGRDDEGRKNKGNVGQVLPDNQIKRHSRMLLSGIPTAFNNAPGGDPRTLRAAFSGMTTPFKEEALNKNTFRAPLRSGFTLIELLVVVLIIAILAAIALPQYQLAVARARTAQLWVRFDALRKAAELYYMTNGTWPNDVRVLDITLAQENAQYGQPTMTESKTWAILYANGDECAVYTTGDPSKREVAGCRNRDIRLTVYRGGKTKRCAAFTAPGETLCKSLSTSKKTDYTYNTGFHRWELD